MSPSPQDSAGPGAASPLEATEPPSRGHAGSLVGFDLSVMLVPQHQQEGGTMTPASPSGCSDHSGPAPLAPAVWSHFSLFPPLCAHSSRKALICDSQKLVMKSSLSPQHTHSSPRPPVVKTRDTEPKMVFLEGSQEFSERLPLLGGGSYHSRQEGPRPACALHAEGSPRDCLPKPTGNPASWDLEGERSTAERPCLAGTGLEESPPPPPASPGTCAEAWASPAGDLSSVRPLSGPWEPEPTPSRRCGR